MRPTHKRITVTLAALVLVISSLACDTSKADRLILALTAAQSLPVAFGVTGEKAQIVADGFGAAVEVATALRDGKTTYEAAVTALNDIRKRPTWEKLDGELRARIEAVWTVAVVILDSLQPTSRSVGERPSLDRIDEAQLRELERLTGRRK
jgi:hypothetical protein